MAGRPKKQQIEIKSPKAKAIKASDVTVFIGIPTDLNAEPNIYKGEILHSNNEMEAVDNIIEAASKLCEQKSPVFEIKKQFDGDKIFEKYKQACETKSDINELLPKIYEITLQCETCVEFGVRRPTSTWAFLAAKPKMLISYDLGRYDEEVSEVERLCEEAGQGFKFIQANVLEIEIEETDCLLSDAFHSKKHVEKELKLHADKVKKYLIFHDWNTFGENGEQPYNDATSPYGAGLGIKYAIYPFLETHPEWQIEYETDINNGLLILKRQ